MDKENEKKKENERNKCEDSSTSGEAITETVVIEQPQSIMFLIKEAKCNWKVKRKIQYSFIGKTYF